MNAKNYPKTNIITTNGIINKIESPQFAMKNLFIEMKGSFSTNKIKYNKMKEIIAHKNQNANKTTIALPSKRDLFISITS